MQIGSRGSYAIQSNPASNNPQSSVTNYLGASIFISYIIAALVLVYLISGELDARYRRLVAQKKGNASQWKQFKLFVTLSSISFAVLSWNMLHFLITSYNAWSARQVSALLHTSTSYVDLAVSVWQWTIHSTLFLDFARSLCASQSGYWWVMQALMATMTTNVIMQSAGRRWKVRTGYYVAIGQILPISFAMNLFSVALVLAQMDGEISQGGEKKTDSDKTRVQRAHDEGQKLLPLWVLGVVAILYRILLYRLPQTRDEIQFMATVLLTRLALYAVCSIAIPTVRALDKRFTRMHLSVLTVFGVQRLITVTSGQDWKNVVSRAWALIESPAVAALSVDYALWFGSLCVLNQSGLLGTPAQHNGGTQDSVW